jgi:hypothetical protein
MVRFFFVLPVDPYPDAFGEKKLIHRKDGSCVIGQAIEITYNGTAFYPLNLLSGMKGSLHSRCVQIRCYVVRGTRVYAC